MALNKVSRYHSLPKGQGEKLLPPEVVKMAKQMASTGGKTAGSKKPNKIGAVEMDTRLYPKTKGRLHDQDPSIVHKKSPWDYVPPDER